MRGNNLSYIIADEKTKEAAVVDPGFDYDDIKKILTEQNFKLLYVIDTHDHTDHIVGGDTLKVLFVAQTVSHKLSQTTTDVQVDDGDVINVGSVVIKVLYTPGHSADSICLLVDGMKLLTGDTLFVGSVGSSSLLGGDSKNMYESLFNKILKLGDEVELCPGHEQGGKSSSTLGEEKRSNKALQAKSYAEFVELIKQQ